MGYHENENQVKFIMLCKIKEKQNVIEKQLLGAKNYDIMSWFFALAQFIRDTSHLIWPGQSLDI